MHVISIKILYIVFKKRNREIILFNYVGIRSNFYFNQYLKNLNIET